MKKSDADAFVLAANPHQWLLTGDNLHEQALVLYERRGRSTLTLREGESTRTWDGVNRSTFLLCAFALENLLKGFLVYENPQWISNGVLAKPLRSHDLPALQKLSKLIPYRHRHRRVLAAFAQGNESWARYPCALTAVSTNDEGHLTDELWSGYLKLVQAYERKLTTLLGAGWRGPHGFEARWDIGANFLTGNPR